MAEPASRDVNVVPSCRASVLLSAAWWLGRIVPASGIGHQLSVPRHADGPYTRGPYRNWRNSFRHLSMYSFHAAANLREFCGEGSHPARHTRYSPLEIGVPHADSSEKHHPRHQVDQPASASGEYLDGLPHEFRNPISPGPGVAQSPLPVASHRNSSDHIVLILWSIRSHEFHSRQLPDGRWDGTRSGKQGQQPVDTQAGIPQVPTIPGVTLSNRTRTSRPDATSPSKSRSTNRSTDRNGHQIPTSMASGNRIVCTTGDSSILFRTPQCCRTHSIPCTRKYIQRRPQTECSCRRARSEHSRPDTAEGWYKSLAAHLHTQTTAHRHFLLRTKFLCRSCNTDHPPG